MYRIGHGDCFLLAFSGETPERPVYVLIDCGYKPGSPAHIETTSAEIAESIREATGGHIDVVIITHEHQDHVNGFTNRNFEGITIGEAWFSWTEDPEDELANQIRKAFGDKLLGLLSARNRLAAAGDTGSSERIDQFLEFELGGDDESPYSTGSGLAFLAAAGGGSSNKNSMKLVKERAANRIRFLRPHESVINLPGASSARAFALGPPRDPELLKSLDPQGAEEFHLAIGARSAGSYLAASARAMDQNLDPGSPFIGRQTESLHHLSESALARFFNTYYGVYGSELPTQRVLEVPSNAGWRRIDNDWLFAAESLALDMNSQTNNSSLALAFELAKGGKVLLFAADAQRGNWLSWGNGTWKDGDMQVTARGLLARAVLYKVGHHGSHNATLNGELDDPTPNLSWMGQEEYSREFTAMITAVRAWAETQQGWDHPLKAIKVALAKKCSGRVFQTDTDFQQMARPAGTSAFDWNAFQKRTTGHRLYFDLVIEP